MRSIRSLANKRSAAEAGVNVERFRALENSARCRCWRRWRSGERTRAVMPGLAIQVGMTDLDGRSPESITPAGRVRNRKLGPFPAFARTWVMDSGLAG